ncbi:GntR family transcriptional regulator [Agromyces rhizosphaerae]|uniref:GntR family transcriptional regulator n=1 Tax=Agromyces rhizosphaerae TaxID=88374 RepID=A0A9W6FNX0_9MICO|nr:GntR family transcriptional regulator [Agromyces rhizosphaerae]GLI26941.1 GntR family transcriptional regulator [Agromyces rhizosphaerae]
MTIEPQVRSVAGANASAVDLVTAEVRRAVLTGALAPGENFSIRDLADQLGVSHIPIREALRRLESQGLIILRQARSASVAPLSSADLAAIYRLRYVVELPLAGASAGKRGPDEVARLEALLERTRNPEPEIAWQAHYDFHEALVHPAANEWDDRILHTIWMAAERYTHLVFDPTPITEAERARRYETHKVLLDAALADDPKSMERLLREHLAANEEKIRTHIDALEQR